MNAPKSLVSIRTHALAILGCALALAATPAATHASNDTAAPVLADKAVALPLKATFEKDTSGKNEAPMIVHLKNESSKAITVAGEIALSVVVHNRPKSRTLPAQTVEAGATLKIDNLAPEDKITLNAEGYTSLVIEVPYQP